MSGTSQKSFKHFTELPSDVVAMVIDDMESADRCRFGGCSIDIHNAVMCSKNYIYEVCIHHSPVYTRITVIYEKPANQSRKGFILEIGKIADKIVKRYSNLDLRTLSKEELDSSTNLSIYVIKEFDRILQSSQRSIKKLVFKSRYSDALHNIDFGSIKHLLHLEILDVDADIDIQQIFSKLRRPLKALHCKKPLEHCAQIYQVQEMVKLAKIDFDYDQFLQLSAKRVDIHIGEMSEKDIHEFIRSWQVGIIDREIKTCRWFIEGEDFNELKFFGLFGIEDYNGGALYLENFNNPGKYGLLYNTDDGLVFNVLSRPIPLPMA